MSCAPQDVVVARLDFLRLAALLCGPSKASEWTRGRINEGFEEPVSPFDPFSASVGVSADSRLPGHGEGEIAGSSNPRVREDLGPLIVRFRESTKS